MINRSRRENNPSDNKSPMTEKQKQKKSITIYGNRVSDILFLIQNFPKYEYIIEKKEKRSPGTARLQLSVHLPHIGKLDKTTK